MIRRSIFFPRPAGVGPDIMESSLALVCLRVHHKNLLVLHICEDRLHSVKDSICKCCHGDAMQRLLPS